MLSIVSNSQPRNPFIDPDDSDYTESCTSIMVGKKASTDGSVMTAHTCDSNYRTWLTFEQRKQFQIGDTEPVYWGLLHTEEASDKRNLVEKGRIPAVKETFAYLNVAYPCMNEKQLAIGETTITGKKILENNSGLFLIEELERIVLQRFLQHLLLVGCFLLSLPFGFQILCFWVSVFICTEQHQNNNPGKISFL
jgi:hypothetical protein